MRFSKAESAHKRSQAWELFEAGKNQQEIADALSISQPTVSLYLRGERGSVKQADRRGKEEKLPQCENVQISITLPYTAQVGDSFEYQFGCWKLVARKCSNGQQNT